jgi:hypothetical protein
LKKGKSNEETIQFVEAKNDDYDIVNRLKTLKPMVEPVKTFKSDISKIQKAEFLKAQSIKSKTTTQYKQQHVTPIKEDPLIKAKKLLDDANNVLQVYLSVGSEDDPIVDNMKTNIKQLATNYFKELTKINLKSTTSTALILLTQSTASDSHPDLAFNMSTFT